MKRAEFHQLIERWQQQQVISVEQAQYMLADYEESATEQSGKKFITTVGVVGATVLVSGFLLIIASNWQFLGKAAQLVLALLLPIIPLSIAYYLHEVKQSTSFFVRVANIFGVGLIGGSISLVGQIYNLESGYTTLFWMWTLLSVPFVFMMRRSENVAMSALLLGLALLTTLFEFFEWWDEEAVLVTLTICGLMYSLGMYGVGSLLRYSEVWKSGARALRLMSASVSSVMLFLMTFQFYAQAITGSSRGDVQWIPVSIALNLLFIGFMVFVLVRAFKYQEERLAVSVVRLLFIYLIVKYFTLFSDMLDTGVLMIVGGILFISGAYYLEKNKRALLALMRPDTTPPPHQHQFSPNQYE